MLFREEIRGHANSIVLTIMVLCAVVIGCLGSDPPANSSTSSPPDASAGMKLYASQGCVACHVVAGGGGKIGPDLSNEANKGRSAQWLTTQLRDPKAYKSDTLMPAYSSLTDAQVRDLVAYLLTLSAEKKAATGPAATKSGTSPASSPEGHPAVAAANRIRTGAQMWSDNCGRCHNYRAPSEFSGAQWSVAMRHMRLRVPLTGEQERLILEFLQAGK